MSKIICDMCGTAYPETADLCPICGCSKGENPQRVEDDTPQEIATEGTRTPVKGGRFSKSNVRRRNKAVTAAAKASGAPVSNHPPEKEGSNKGLVIVAVVLLLAIIAVIGFIYVRYFMPTLGGGQEQTKGTTLSTTEGNPPDTTAQTDTTPKVIPCEKLTVSDAIVELDALNEAHLLNVTTSPADTTDIVTYSTSDETIAQVSNRGRITAAGPGQAVITITCGGQVVKCRVVCNFQEQTEPQETDPSEPTEPEESDGSLNLNREDFTLRRKGETWPLYSGTIGKNLVTFSSDDEAIAKFENGTVTAVGPGVTKVHAEYNGQKVSCTVRCSFPADEEPGEQTGGTCTIYINNDKPVYELSETSVEVTIELNGSFRIALMDQNKNNVNVSWSSSDSSICSVSDGRVTRHASGTVTISATYGGVTYKCIVH